MDHYRETVEAYNRMLTRNRTDGRVARTSSNVSLIREFWDMTSLWLFKGFDRGELLERGTCFACGWEFSHCKKYECDIAHIVPRYIDKNDSIDNLHMLCTLCHYDSEYIESEGPYWEWFFSRTMLSPGISVMARRNIDLVEFFKLKAKDFEFAFGRGWDKGPQAIEHFISLGAEELIRITVEALKLKKEGRAKNSGGRTQG
jgi:HNH endonuclease